MPWTLHEPDLTVKRRVAEFERGDDVRRRHDARQQRQTRILRGLVHVFREAGRNAELRAGLLGLSAVLGLRDRADADHDVFRQLARAFDRFQTGRGAQRNFQHFYATRVQSARHVLTLLDRIEREHRNHRAKAHDLAYCFRRHSQTPYFCSV